MTSISAEHIVKVFDVPEEIGRIKAVDDVTLKVAEGETLAILGPSGCGKTTLLRIMAGLEEPDSGRVLHNNIPLAEVPRKDRNIGMVFQNWALVPHWRSRQTVGFFLKLRKREYEVPERVRRVSSITGVGIDHLMSKYPSQMSGGEKQRVAIARAFARDLQLLMFDEPFANLDAKFRTAARVELRRLLNEFPITTVFVTHDQMEATSLASRIAIMKEGKLVQVGTYNYLYESPVNLFVADFLGSPEMNLFKGKVVDGQWQGENFGGYPIRSDLANGTKVTLGVRANGMYLESGGTPAVISNIIPHYPQRYMQLDVWLAKETWSLHIPFDTHLEIGKTIYCKIDPEVILYFDTQTGQRIG